MPSIAQVSLTNRAFIALASVIVVIIGVFSMFSLRQELIPEVDLPQVAVIATLPGASAEQVHDRIAEPLEGSLQTIEDVDQTMSQSESGLAMVTIELDYGTDVAGAANEVDAALNQLADIFPQGTSTQVLSGGTGEIPAAVVSVSADLAPAELADRLDSVVLPDVEDIEGVAQAQVIGAPERIVQVAPDDDAMSENELTEEDLTEAMEAVGLVLPSTPVTQDGTSFDVTIGDEIADLEELRSIPVFGSAAPEQPDAPEQPEAPEDPGQVPPEEQPGVPGQEPGEGVPAEPEAAPTDPEAAPTDQLPGQPQQPADPTPPEPVALGEVAQVEITDQDATSVSRTDGQPSLTVLVVPTATANFVDVSDGVVGVMEESVDQLGGDAAYVVVFDQAPFITDSIAALAQEGGMGLVMAVVVILIFLGAIRPTLVTAISIPLSLLMTFVGVLVAGYTLNLLTLAAVTLSVGRVVDDSIVVIENIRRHLGYGGDKRRRILEAVGEVAGAITSSTLATVIVFLPLVLVGGFAGELFRPFALTVAITQGASLLVALTIVPVLAYWFLPATAEEIEPTAGTPDQDEPALAQSAQTAESKPPRRGRRRRRSRQAEPPPAPAAPPEPPKPEQPRSSPLHETDADRNRLTAMYRPVLRGTQRRPVLTLVASVAILVGSFALMPLLAVNLLGGTGQNLALVTQTLEPGTTLEESTETAEEAEQALLGLEDVEIVQTTIGGGAMGFGGGSNEIQYSITTDISADQEALTEQLEATISDLPDSGTVEAADFTALGSATADVQITGPTAQARAEATQMVFEAVADLPDAADASTDLQEEQPGLQITVDRDAAAERGLSENAVVGIVAQQIGDQSSGTITLAGADLAVYLTSADDVETVDDVRNVEILGESIEEIATVEEVAQVPEITTIGGQQTITVSVSPVDPDDVGALGAQIGEALEELDLPDGATAEQAGVTADIDEAFGELALAALAAVMLVYLLLVWLLKSLAQPLILLVSIPFASTGAILLMLATGTPLGLPALIGALMLIGIVVTNAIVLMDLINQYRRRGLELAEAVRLGSLRRLRPIVMTAAATIFALIPLALGLTDQSGFISAPLAIVTIGGLFSSTLLTLILVPVLYLLVERGKERRAQRRAAAA